MIANSVSGPHSGPGRRMIDRRQLLTGVVGGLVASLVLPRRSAAQQLGHVDLNDRLALLTTGGTNVVALLTAEGLVLVAVGRPGFMEGLAARVRRVRLG